MRLIVSQNEGWSVHGSNPSKTGKSKFFRSIIIEQSKPQQVRTFD